MSVVLSVVFFVLAAVASFILRRRIAQHELRIGRIALLELALYDVHYSGSLYNDSYHFTFTAAQLSLRFHLPRHPNPRWLTFTAHDILYRSSTADISVGTLTALCWFFPLLFRQTPGPWVNAALDDFRIRVFGSAATPAFVKQLRANLVGAVLDGEVLRADAVGTTARCAGVTEAAVQCAQDPDGDGANEHPGRDRSTVPAAGPYDEQLGDSKGAAQESIAHDHGGFRSIGNDKKRAQAVPFLSREQDEVRLSAYARGLMVKSKEGRMYSFQSIDAQLRRNWVANRGSFVMIAKESRWVRVPWLYQMEAAPSFWSQLLSSILHFPYDLIHVLNYPMTTVNLYVPRADITFDNFRLRDAELIPQTIALIEEKMAKADVQWQELFVNFAANAAIGALRS